MTDSPLTLSDLMTLVAIIGGVGGLWWRLTSILEAHRVASETGRRRLYEHLDQRMERMEATFQRRDLHERDMKAAFDAIDEQHRLITGLTARVCPFPPQDK